MQVVGQLQAGGRALQSVDEVPEGQVVLQNGCEATQVAECQAAGKVCFNKACVQVWVSPKLRHVQS